jgi:molecular chaperone DnaK (HSP70)
MKHCLRIFDPGLQLSDLDGRILILLRAAWGQAKYDLSDFTQIDVFIVNFYGGKDLRVTITRDEYESFAVIC